MSAVIARLSFGNQVKSVALYNGISADELQGLLSTVFALPSPAVGFLAENGLVIPFALACRSPEIFPKSACKILLHQAPSPKQSPVVERTNRNFVKTSPSVQEIVDDETEEEEDADEDEITETELALNEIIRFLTELEARGLMSKKHVGLLEELLFNNSTLLYAAYSVAISASDSEYFAEICQDVATSLESRSGRSVCEAQDEVLQLCDQLYLAEKISENQLLYLRHLVLIRDDSVANIYDHYQEPSGSRGNMARELYVLANKHPYEGLHNADVDAEEEDARARVGAGGGSSSRDARLRREQEEQEQQEEEDDDDAETQRELQRIAQLRAHGISSSSNHTRAQSQGQGQNKPQKFPPQVTNPPRMATVVSTSSSSSPSSASSSTASSPIGSRIAATTGATPPTSARASISTIVSNMISNRSLSSTESVTLLEMIRRQDPFILAAADVYAQDGNVEDFTDTMARCVRLELRKQKADLNEESIRQKMATHNSNLLHRKLIEEEEKLDQRELKNAQMEYLAAKESKNAGSSKPNRARLATNTSIIVNVDDDDDDDDEGDDNNDEDDDDDEAFYEAMKAKEAAARAKIRNSMNHNYISNNNNNNRQVANDRDDDTQDTQDTEDDLNDEFAGIDLETLLLSQNVRNIWEFTVPPRFLKAVFVATYRQQLSTGEAKALCDLYQSNYDLVQAAWEVYTVNRDHEDFVDTLKRIVRDLLFDEAGDIKFTGLGVDTAELDDNDDEDDEDEEESSGSDNDEEDDDDDDDATDERQHQLRVYPLHENVSRQATTNSKASGATSKFTAAETAQLMKSKHEAQLSIAAAKRDLLKHSLDVMVRQNVITQEECDSLYSRSVQGEDTYVDEAIESYANDRDVSKFLQHLAFLAKYSAQEIAALVSESNQDDDNEEDEEEENDKMYRDVAKISSETTTASAAAAAATAAANNSNLFSSSDMTSVISDLAAGGILSQNHVSILFTLARQRDTRIMAIFAVLRRLQDFEDFIDSLIRLAIAESSKSSGQQSDSSSNNGNHSTPTHHSVPAPPPPTPADTPLIGVTTKKGGAAGGIANKKMSLSREAVLQKLKEDSKDEQTNHTTNNNKKVVGTTSLSDVQPSILSPTDQKTVVEILARAGAISTLHAAHLNELINQHNVQLSGVFAQYEKEKDVHLLINRLRELRPSAITSEFRPANMNIKKSGSTTSSIPSSTAATYSSSRFGAQAGDDDEDGESNTNDDDDDDEELSDDDNEDDNEDGDDRDNHIAEGNQAMDDEEDEPEVGVSALEQDASNLNSVSKPQQETVHENRFMDIVHNMHLSPLETAALRLAIAQGSPSIKSAVDNFRESGNETQLANSLKQACKTIIVTMLAEKGYGVVDDDDEDDNNNNNNTKNNNNSDDDEAEEVKNVAEIRKSKHENEKSVTSAAAAATNGEAHADANTSSTQGALSTQSARDHVFPILLSELVKENILAQQSASKLLRLFAAGNQVISAALDVYDLDSNMAELVDTLQCLTTV